ncbi:MAG: glycine cleavage system protein GcvH [Actinomycetota bacterium]|nr:glycine cleavage system protein GcvH [Actinomycetota bacterium]
MSQKIKYSKTYEYIIVEDNIGIVGVGQEAVEKLGDIYLIDLPKVGNECKKGDAVGTIESVKSVSEIYSPVSGSIFEVNENLNDKPELVTDDCLGKGWIFKIKIEDFKELDQLMDYEEFIKFIN